MPSKHILFMGDSIARYLLQTLLRAMGRNGGWHIETMSELGRVGLLIELRHLPYRCQGTLAMDHSPKGEPTTCNSTQGWSPGVVSLTGPAKHVEPAFTCHP